MINEIAVKYEIHQDMLSSWKTGFISDAAKKFS